MTAQHEIEFGKKLRDKGIEKAVKNADRVHNEWSDTAYYFFKYWIRYQNSSFKMEDFREWVKDMLPAPPSLRAFGWVAVRARVEGLIEKVGYTEVDNIKAHRTPVALWKRV